MLRFIDSWHEIFKYIPFVPLLMEKVVRFGVSFEPALLERFDRFIEKNGYKNRSEAIRDIIREQISSEDSSAFRGLIIVVFDPRTKPYQNKLADIENEYHCLVKHSSKRFIDHHTGLLVLDVNGKKERIERLMAKLRTAPGISDVRFEKIEPEASK